MVDRLLLLVEGLGIKILCGNIYCFLRWNSMKMDYFFASSSPAFIISALHWARSC